MGQENLEASLKEIRILLSQLHGEVTALEDQYSQVLLCLKKFEGACEVDDLTGLLRRRAFFRKWEALLAECRRMEENSGVILLDIDHFKQVNDTHGHSTGDEVLRRVSLLLKQYESPSCLVSRLGGEEFAVAIRGSDAQIMGMAEMIRRNVERLHGPVLGPDGQTPTAIEWKCTLSAGTASTRTKGNDPSRLLKAADEALYQSKRTGRNRVSAA